MSENPSPPPPDVEDDDDQADNGELDVSGPPRYLTPIWVLVMLFVFCCTASIPILILLTFITTRLQFRG